VYPDAIATQAWEQVALEKRPEANPGHAMAISPRVA
jgi:hypothetical protein